VNQAVLERPLAWPLQPLTTGACETAPGRQETLNSHCYKGKERLCCLYSKAQARTSASLRMPPC